MIPNPYCFCGIFFLFYLCIKVIIPEDGGCLVGSQKLYKVFRCCLLGLICLFVDNLCCRVDDISGQIVRNDLQNLQTVLQTVGIGIINRTNLVGSLCNCGSNGSYVCTLIDFHAAERFGNLLGCDGRYVVCFLQNACIDQCFSCVFSNRNGTVCQCDAGCLVQILQARNFCIASLIGYNADLIVYDIVAGSSTRRFSSSS